jgi:acyl-CoA synthetase (AMP-forming)/AMP-acid ligase II
LADDGSRPSLYEALAERARLRPDRIALVLLEEEGMARTLTAGELRASAERWAAGMARLGVRQGDLIVLALPHSVELVVAFWAALSLGALPTIFPYPSARLGPGVFQDQIETLVVRAEAHFLLTQPDQQSELSSRLEQLGCRVTAADSLLGQAVPIRDPLGARARTDPRAAYVQFSSGTTGLQKGVILSHRAVLNNLQAIAGRVGLTEEDVVICWLPLNHDMGLVSGVLLPVVSGALGVLISPFQWVRDPGVLFRAIRTYHGTICWMPNFAFNHCVHGMRERDLEGLDLRGMRAFFNASEPVRYDSLMLFWDRFAPYGLQRRALGSSYGMAEVTAAATISPMETPPRVDWVALEDLQRDRRATPVEAQSSGATALVSSGRPVQGVEVQIVDGQDRPLPPRRIGQILVRSNAGLMGYRGTPPPDALDLESGWLHSGDLGYLAEGDLFVTGRIRDLIISGGRNIYPEDLETVAGGIPGLRPGRAVAFAIDDPEAGTEAIVLVAELRETVPEAQRLEIEREVRRRMTQTLDVTLSDLRLVGRDWVIKTSSGKVARSANREKYLSEA